MDSRVPAARSRSRARAGAHFEIFERTKLSQDLHDIGLRYCNVDHPTPVGIGSAAATNHCPDHTRAGNKRTQVVTGSNPELLVKAHLDGHLPTAGGEPATEILRYPSRNPLRVTAVLGRSSTQVFPFHSGRRRRLHLNSRQGNQQDRVVLIEVQHPR